MKHKISKPLIFLILTLFINLTFSGCYYTREAVLEDSKSFKIDKIEMKDGKTIKFRNDKIEYAYYLNNEIVVYNVKEGKEKVIPMSEVKKVYVRKFNAPATIIFTTVGLGVLFFVAILFGFETNGPEHNPTTN